MGLLFFRTLHATLTMEPHLALEQDFPHQGQAC